MTLYNFQNIFKQYKIFNLTYLIIIRRINDDFIMFMDSLIPHKSTKIVFVSKQPLGKN